MYIYTHRYTHTYTHTHTHTHTHTYTYTYIRSFPGAQRHRTHLPMQEARRLKFDRQVGTMPWRRAWWPTPASSPGESLVGYRPQASTQWGHQEAGLGGGCVRAHLPRLQQGVLSECVVPTLTDLSVFPRLSVINVSKYRHWLLSTVMLAVLIKVGRRSTTWRALAASLPWRHSQGVPAGSAHACQCRRRGSDPWSGTVPHAVGPRARALPQGQLPRESPEPRRERAALLQLEKARACSSEDAAEQKPSKIMQNTY